MRPPPTTVFDVRPDDPPADAVAGAVAGAVAVNTCTHPRRLVAMAEAVLLARVLTRRVRMSILQVGEN
jgi:hypothetical protein